MSLNAHIKQITAQGILGREGIWSVIAAPIGWAAPDWTKNLTLFYELLFLVSLPFIVKFIVKSYLISLVCLAVLFSIYATGIQWPQTFALLFPFVIIFLAFFLSGRGRAFVCVLFIWCGLTLGMEKFGILVLKLYLKA